MDEASDLSSESLTPFPYLEQVLPEPTDKPPILAVKRKPMI